VAAVEVAGDAARFAALAEVADLVVVDPASWSTELRHGAGLVVVDLPDPAQDVAGSVLDSADVFTCRTESDADTWRKSLDEGGRGEPIVLTIADAPDDGGWLSAAAPLRDLVRAPWPVRRRRPEHWTEDAQLALEQQRRRNAELAAVVAAQEAKLEQIRRLPGYRVLRAALGWLERARARRSAS
jgi:hypothetical protein